MRLLLEKEKREIGEHLSRLLHKHVKREITDIFRYPALLGEFEDERHIVYNKDNMQLISSKSRDKCAFRISSETNSFLTKYPSCEEEFLSQFKQGLKKK